MMKGLSYPFIPVLCRLTAAALCLFAFSPFSIKGAAAALPGRNFRSCIGLRKATMLLQSSRKRMVRLRMVKEVSCRGVLA